MSSISSQDAVAPGAAQPPSTKEEAAWILGAPPTSVIAGGVILLLIAAALLAVGQRETTGTIVMLSFCIAPIGVITLLIGFARLIASRSRRG